MAADLLDSVGAVIWPGDTVTTPGGSGTVIALAETGDDSLASDLITVSVAGLQSVYVAAAVTVTSRASEMAATADEATAGEVI